MKQQWWWWFQVHRDTTVHERTYLKRSEAKSFANASQKVRGGVWSVSRVTKKRSRVIAKYEGIRHE